MKLAQRRPIHTTISITFFLILLYPCLGYSQERVEEDAAIDNTEIENQTEILWDIKAFRPNIGFVEIKAIDKKGNVHDVKAIQSTDDTSILNVKAIVNGEKLPIKLIIKKNGQYYPVKAIDGKGHLIDIKGVAENGDILDVKGVSKSGNIVHLRMITKTLALYNIIAISPEGKVNDVKGIKMMDTPIETVINGVKIFAHVKSLAQQ